MPAHSYIPHWETELAYTLEGPSRQLQIHLWRISLSQKFTTKLKGQTLSRFSFSGVDAAFQSWGGGDLAQRTALRRW